MGVQSLVLVAPADGILDWSTNSLRPRFEATWANDGAGGTVDYTVLHEWDTTVGFASGDLITDSNTTPDASTFNDEGVPPSDMGPDGQLWYYRFTVTDNDDSNSGTLAANVEITFKDPIHQPRMLWLEYNVGGGFHDGGPDSSLAANRHLYTPYEVTTDVPIPFIFRIIPTVLETGDALIIQGQGFDNVARDWSAVARLYDDPDPEAVGASYVSLTELGFTAGSTEDELIVSIPGGAQTGWVVVKNIG
jgi:hypothetical protein